MTIKPSIMNTAATTLSPAENLLEPVAHLSIERTNPITAPLISLPTATVQGEWDQTLLRLREVCEIVEAPKGVSAVHYAYLTIKKIDDVAAVERILFDNLLLAIYTRTEHLNGTIFFSGQWLWRWRKAVPYVVEKVGHVNRLVPWQPQHQWTYRFNIIEADM